MAGQAHRWPMYGRLAEDSYQDIIACGHDAKVDGRDLDPSASSSLVRLAFP